MVKTRGGERPPPPPQPAIESWRLFISAFVARILSMCACGSLSFLCFFRRVCVFFLSLFISFFLSFFLSLFLSFSLSLFLSLSYKVTKFYSFTTPSEVQYTCRSLRGPWASDAQKGDRSLPGSAVDGPIAPTCTKGIMVTRGTNQPMVKKPTDGWKIW